jgi:hypothetical protein
MNPLLITGTCVVFLALAFYSLGMRQERKTRAVTDQARNFLFAGLACDVTATCFMILGSRHTPFTFHGLLGYSALVLMGVDVGLLRRFRKRHGPSARLPSSLHAYSQAAYAWWVLAFIAGAVVAARMKHGG